uniref:Uncharacterized protein n=1 Tax=viral metagenome TaxID=1070528 RepID=A0A6C0E7V6_9ZZZZ
MVYNISIQSYHMATYLYGKLNIPSKENPRLDPLSTLVKLAILSKKPEGTKLSLESNYINFTEPSHWIVQGIIRTYQRDSYNDLRDLTKTLHKAVDWYSNDPTIETIIKLAIQGLEMLKKTYGKTGKADAVQSYIDILNGIKKEDLSLAKDPNSEGTLDDIKLHQILKEVWDKNDISIILGFFERIEKASSDEEINDSIKGIEVILKSNHKKIEQQVRILSSIQ